MVFINKNNNFYLMASGDEVYDEKGIFFPKIFAEIQIIFLFARQNDVYNS